MFLVSCLFAVFLASDSVRAFFLLCWLAGERWVDTERSRCRFPGVGVCEGRRCCWPWKERVVCFAAFSLLGSDESLMGEEGGLAWGGGGGGDWSGIGLGACFGVSGHTLSPALWWSAKHCLHLVGASQALAWCPFDRQLLHVGTLCSLWYRLAVNKPMRRVFGRGFAGTSMYRNLLPVFHRVSFPEGSLSRSSIKLERILTPRD